MPRCARILIAALTLLTLHTIGPAATISFLFTATIWTLTTPAALITIAALAAWHLTAYHTPRRRPTHAHT